MQNPVRVEFVRRTVPADESTLAARAGAVERLNNLGQLDATAGVVNAEADAWLARIGGVELPLLDFSVQKLDDGQVAVSLVAIVDSVHIGDPSTGTPAPQVRPAAPEPRNRGRWGDPSIPDPREGIPGWKPEPSLGEQVADHAAAVAE